MRIGIDFDNTIAGYDHVFRREAQRLGWLAPAFIGGKRRVRAALDGERWMRLQGQVYGRLMPAAELLPGAESFFSRARKAGHELFIVSHKTRFGHFDGARVDLRRAALEWMSMQGFFRGDPAYFKRCDVSFHDTRAEKLAHIGRLGLQAFVDDLPAVLGDPEFPKGVQCYLYGARSTELRGVRGAVDWEALEQSLLGVREPVASRLGLELLPYTGGAGGNNRLQKVRRGARTLALKTYVSVSSDRRDRMGSELAALRFLGSALPGWAPRIEAAHPECGALLLEWIVGQPAASSESDDLGAMVRFLRNLHGVRGSAAAAELPGAAEACLCGAELLRQVEARVERLECVAQLYPELEDFLQQELRPALKERAQRALDGYKRAGLGFDEPLSRDLQTLSPSDFGTHNALRTEAGQLVFLDFEYFGWDDPAKLVADTLLHPASGLTQETRVQLHTELLRVYGQDRMLARRIEMLFGLYGLRWCCILLNVFLPERQVRLAFADARQGEAALGEQLTKARSMLARSQQAPRNNKPAANHP